MSKLIQKIKWGVDNTKIDMYVYGEADFSSNLAMQEPLEKLYQYENQPDIREKIKEYIGELEIEIDQLENTENLEDIYIVSRLATVNYLKSILEEII